MKAIVQLEYGSADTLKLADVEKPQLREDSVLVKVNGTAVHKGDLHLMRGSPFLVRFIFGGLFKPKIKILGTDFAGLVEAVGNKVTKFKPGDEVFGDLSEAGFGAFAEYVSVPEKTLALKPVNIGFEQAATVPVSAMAALRGLRDSGKIRPGQKVLIIGASGGVGSFAIQIAKAYGAEVTALCSQQKAAQVAALGADHLVHSLQVDAEAFHRKFDIILDAAAYRSFFAWLPAVAPKGSYVVVGGSIARIFQAMLIGPLVSRYSHAAVKCLVSRPDQNELIALKELIEAGKVTPCIDSTFKLSEVPAALRRLEERQVVGKIAIKVD